MIHSQKHTDPVCVCVCQWNVRNVHCSQGRGWMCGLWLCFMVLGTTDFRPDQVSRDPGLQEYKTTGCMCVCVQVSVCKITHQKCQNIMHVMWSQRPGSEKPSSLCPSNRQPCIFTHIYTEYLLYYCLLGAGSTATTTSLELILLVLLSPTNDQTYIHTRDDSIQVFYCRLVFKKKLDTSAWMVSPLCALRFSNFQRYLNTPCCGHVTQCYHTMQDTQTLSICSYSILDRVWNVSMCSTHVIKQVYGWCTGRQEVVTV